MDKALMQRLQKHLNYRKGQARKLEEENRQLHARESILLAYCQTLLWLRQQECQQPALLNDSDGEQQQQQQGLWLASDMAQFSEGELLLVQQLQCRLTEQWAGSFDPMLLLGLKCSRSRL